MAVRHTTTNDVTDAERSEFLREREWRVGNGPNCSSFQFRTAALNRTMRSHQHPRIEPRFEPISLVILLVVAVLIAVAFVYLDQRFADKQHHATIVPKPATQK